MSSDGAKQQASREIISFVKEFTDLMEKHLDSVRDVMLETVDGVMANINNISKATSEKKRQANEVLMNTYTNPDSEARTTMDSVQDEVSRVFEDAQQGSVPAAPEGAQNDDLSNKLRRSAGLFSKHMEALETLDEELQEVLLSMMGALSRDDIVAQRIEHIGNALNALQTSLSYLLVDYDHRCKPEEVDRFKRDLKNYVFASYTMEEEKRSFREIWPNDVPAKKAS